MCLGDLTKAHAPRAVADNGCCVQVERFPANVAAFQACAAQARFHAFNNQRPFQLGNRRNDRHDGFAQRA
jgi:hypothetical protein